MTYGADGWNYENRTESEYKRGKLPLLYWFCSPRRAEFSVPARFCTELGRDLAPQVLPMWGLRAMEKSA